MAETPSGETSRHTEPSTGTHISIGGWAPSISVTVPEEAERYMITDDQLNMLSDGSKGHCLEIALAMLGFGLGMSQNIYHLIQSVRAEVPVAFGTVAAAFVSGICLVVALVKFLEYRGKKSASDEVMARIKAGTKLPVK